jgi:general secretion pathway protein D
MLAFKRLGVVAGILAGVLLTSPGALDARNRKGDKYLKLAIQAEDKKDYQAALDYYTQADRISPSDPVYEVGMRRMRFQVGEMHVHAGQTLRKQGQLEPALVEFQKAFATDPSSAVALQEMKTTMEMMDAARKSQLPPGELGLTPGERARKESQTRIESLQTVPELKPITRQISTLKMNNQPPKVLYETVGKLAGINVVFDPQYQSTGKNVNLDLANSTLEEALDYIALLTKTFWKPVTSNTIFVAEDNITKRRDYEDQVVKVFYLQNVTSVQEFQEIVTAVRSITDIRRMFTYNAQNAVMCRGTVDQIALAEKLFHDLDKPKAEVVVDVIVLTANRDKTRSLAAGLTTSAGTGLSIPIGFTPRSSITTPIGSTPTPAGGTPAPATTTSGISISRIGKINFSDFSLSLPGALLQALMTDDQTQILQSPQVRASDGMKVSLKIGQKYPYATGSFQPGIGTVGVSPLVSTQFQFVDVGVNLDLQPHVHAGSDEITMHVLVDISAVDRTLDLGGLTQPVIGQRKNETDIRVRNGEPTILGGLMDVEDSRGFSGIPGFVNVPVLGKFLLGSSSKSTKRDQLLIAIIPHIVRTPDLTALDMRGVAAGTDQTVKVMMAPRKDAAPEPAPAPSQPAATTPAAPVTPPAAEPSAAAAPPSMLFFPNPLQTTLGGSAQVTVQAQNVTDLAGAQFHIKWDPKILRLDTLLPGNLIGDGGPEMNPPTIDIRNDAGEATLSLTRVAGAPGVNGGGPIVTLSFAAVGRGASSVTISDLSLRDTKQRPMAVPPPTLSVSVQ